MKTKPILLACLACPACGAFRPAFGWGRTGHEAIARIAECSLAPRALAEQQTLKAGYRLAKPLDDIFGE